MRIKLSFDDILNHDADNLIDCNLMLEAAVRYLKTLRNLK